VTHLTATITPTLLNEFVFSYSADHLSLVNSGPFQVPAGFTMTSLFNTGAGGAPLQQLPAHSPGQRSGLWRRVHGESGIYAVDQLQPDVRLPGHGDENHRQPQPAVRSGADRHSKNEQSAPTSVGLGGLLTC